MRFEFALAAFFAGAALECFATHLKGGPAPLDSLWLDAGVVALCVVLGAIRQGGKA